MEGNSQYSITSSHRFCKNNLENNLCLLWLKPTKNLITVKIVKQFFTVYKFRSHSTELDYKHKGGENIDLENFGVVSAGKKGAKKTEHYETKYMRDINVKEHITGELYISPIKNSDYGERFFIWITSHDDEIKWGISIQNPYIIVEDNGMTKIYAKQGGRFYQFLDSLFKELSGDYVIGESYTIDFEKFRETIKNIVKSVTVHAIPDSNPKAKYPYFEVIDVEKK